MSMFKPRYIFGDAKSVPIKQPVDSITFSYMNLACKDVEVSTRWQFKRYPHIMDIARSIPRRKDDVNWVTMLINTKFLYAILHTSKK